MANGRAITLWIAFTVGFVHTLCGILILMEPSVVYTTPLESLHAMTGPLRDYLGTQPGFLPGLFLLLAGVTALLASAWGSMRVKVFLIIPQQLALLAQFVSINNAVISGMYPDGYVPAGGWEFILADQLWAWSASIAHTLEAGRLCWQAWRSGWNGRR